MSKVTYNSALVIGMGLIGSSIARALREKQLSKKIFAIDRAVSYTHLTLPTNTTV